MQAVKEYLFPVFCVSCNREGEWLCLGCRRNCPRVSVQTCPVCKRENAGGYTCERCRAYTTLDGLTALYVYDEYGSVGKLIKNFKYRNAEDIAAVWREMLVADYLENTDYVLVPVPLHARRFRERGFNQAEVLAQILAERYHLSLDKDHLQRIRYTAQQARLQKEARLRNVQGALSWIGADAAPKKVLLIDDVYTTGATMQECAKVLKARGSERVEGLVLARGS